MHLHRLTVSTMHSTQVTIRERVADDSTRVDPMRDERPSAKKGREG